MANLEPYVQSPFNKARKDKFLLSLNFPEAIKKISNKLDRSNRAVIPDALQFSVYGAVVPDIEIAAVNVRYSGQTYVTSSHVREPYPPVTVNFTVDNRYNNYWVIYKWLSIINDPKTNVYDFDNLTESKKNISGGRNLELYKANLSIFALDEYDKRTVEFLYTEAFPTALGGISFNHRDASEIETNFTFSYSQLLISLVEHVDSL
jgi:hypothetical protein